MESVLAVVSVAKDRTGQPGAIPKKWSLPHHYSANVAPTNLNHLPKKANTDEESALGFFLETVFPFILAGCGMVGAGILFSKAQKWSFLSQLPQAVMLVPALLGLKGNLEMTLASRLSTQANLGEMSSRKQQLHSGLTNVALVQAQTIVVSLVAAGFAIIMHSLQTGKWSLEDSVLLCLTSVASASMTSLILSTLMICVVILALKFGLNPDNITMPIAASLGDTTTLVIMIGVGTFLLNVEGYLKVKSFILAVWSLGAIPFIFVASRDDSAKVILTNGWYAIFTAMLISSGAGVILERAVAHFPGIAPFQPVVNGAGGNLAAIQASRISTALHKAGGMGTLTTPLVRFLNPLRAFFDRDCEARAARVLAVLALPGHAIFMTIILLSIRSERASIPFVFAYMLVVLIQVLLLLYASQLIVPAMWLFKVDPDNSAIPLLTACGDLLGAALLSTAFHALAQMSLVSTDLPLVIPPFNFTILHPHSVYQ